MKGKSPFEKTLCGIAYKGLLPDGTEPITSIHGKSTREYRLWCGMINRCYCNCSAYDSYKDCTVCERWLCFSNFLFDLPKIEGYDLWKNNEGKRICLDKDLKQQDKDIKVYSLENCCFIENNKNSRESAIRNGLGKDKRKTKIIAKNLKTGETIVFESQNEAARILQCNQANIFRVLQGKYKQTKGYTFEYYDSLDTENVQ